METKNIPLGMQILLHSQRDIIPMKCQILCSIIQSRIG